MRSSTSVIEILHEVSFYFRDGQSALSQIPASEDTNYRIEADFPMSKRRKTIRALPVPAPVTPRLEPKLVNNDSIAITESDDEASLTTLSQSPMSMRERSPMRFEVSPSTVMERRV